VSSDKGKRVKESALLELARLYAQIDRSVERLVERHAARLNCKRGCCACCVDDLTVFEIEAENIRRRHSVLLRSQAPHPSGRCAFLDADGACRIYQDRPYVCRTQGLPLRWLEEAADGQIFELRDICPLNDDGEAIEQLSENDCWTIGPAESQLAKLQALFGGGKMNRVRLRELFGSNKAFETNTQIREEKQPCNGSP